MIKIKPVDIEINTSTQKHYYIHKYQQWRVKHQEKLNKIEDQENTSKKKRDKKEE